MLRVDGLEVYYGEAQALFGVSLEVEAGELVTLIGANGAGKTTTLRAISGIQPVRQGEVLFEGRSVTRTPAPDRSALGMSLVPEGRGLWARMTVRENLELGAFNPQARLKLADSLDQVFALFPVLKERTKQLVGSMSGGEQQMVAIGRALMSRPRLLMLDEPSLGLAPLLVDQVFSSIEVLHRGGLTILLVEQDLQRALRVATRAYVLETGRVAMQGPSAELLADERVRGVYLGI